MCNSYTKSPVDINIAVPITSAHKSWYEEADKELDLNFPIW